MRRNDTEVNLLLQAPAAARAPLMPINQSSSSDDEADDDDISMMMYMYM